MKFSHLILFLFCIPLFGCSSKEAPSADDRRYSEIILSKGGKFTINDIREIKNIDQLPDSKYEITGVDFNNINITDADLEEIAGLRHILQLGLHSTFITDESMLTIKNFTELRELEISYTQISNESINDIVQLKKLKKIFISGTEIIDDGLARLRDDLPKCKVINLQTKKKKTQNPE